MAQHITEEALKEGGLKLFDKLEKEAGALEADRAVFEESTKLISEGRDLLGQGNFAEALARYNGASDKIAAAISARSEPLAWKLLWVEFIYLFILLLLGYLTCKWPNFCLWSGVINQSVQTAWFGALGGITIAIYGIYSHVQQKDFDPKFKLWYLCKPIIGAIFGWFVYLIFFLGLVSVQGIGENKMTRPEMAFLIAFLAGFSERFTIKMIDKLMSVLTSYENRPSPAKKQG